MTMYPPFSPARRAQTGAATLLFLLLAALAMLAATAAALSAMSGTQKMQYAEHVATQADMTAWAGVSVLAEAVKALPENTVLTAGQPVLFTGLQSGISATYVGKSGSNLLFDVKGTSAGANAVLRVAISPAVAGGGGSGTSLTTTVLLRGKTTLTGDIKFVGSTKLNISVVDGDLSLQGSVTGLGTVCTTGNLTVSAAISVDAICANGNIQLNGAATAQSINAGGTVTLAGGAASTIGTINANGAVVLSGGSAKAGTINSGAFVEVTGGAASAGVINSMGYIKWTSSSTANSLNANGDVTYSPSGSSNNTVINSLGHVYVTSAKTITAMNGVTLMGYYGQGVTGVLNAGGSLAGTSWGTYGGAVVASGTVRSIVSPYPSSVKVTVDPTFSPKVLGVSLSAVPTFSAAPITIDVYPLKSSANYVFTGVDSNNNPLVSVANVNGVPDGNYVIANVVKNYTTNSNYLCKSVSGTICVGEPLMKVCQGYSDSNACFSYDKINSAWTIVGTQIQPGVFWFQGGLTLGSGNWVGSFLASGNVSTSGQAAVFSPNYEPAAVACSGAADSANGIKALISFTAMSGSFYPKQLCTSAGALSGNAVGNLAIVAGGYVNGTFVGGNISLGASTKVFGSVLAGGLLNTGGSTSLMGPLYAAGQGGVEGTGNSMQGSTTIDFTGGSNAYNPGTPPCMSSSCQGTTIGNNIVWVSPI